MSETANILREARKLIATKGWTQRAYARDASGKDVHPADPEAVAFCMYGAFRTMRCPEEVRQLLCRAIDAPVSLWNDEEGRTKEQVLAAFDKAIQLAESRP